jgi:hypothetical protein
MRFTPYLARLSIAITAAVFVMVGSLWMRSVVYWEWIGFKSKDSSCGLGQSNGVIYFHIPEEEFDGPGFHYGERVDREPYVFGNLWWGGFKCDADIRWSDPFVIFCIPHWFVLCLSSLFLLPAGLHWRMRKTHAAQQEAASSGRDAL